MTAPEVDAGRIAALIDGRLPPDERERVLAAIDASPALREAYADSLAALDAPAQVPLRQTRPRIPKLTRLQWLEVAAAAGVVIAITPTVVRRLGPARVPDSTVVVAAVPASDSIATAVLDEPIWGATRGAGESALAPEARAVRLGAAIASYEMRQHRADSAAAPAALDVVALLETFPGGVIAANAYRELSSGRAVDQQAVRSASVLAEQVVGGQPMRLGRWLQNARFAAAVGDSSYFRGSTATDISKAAITMDGRAETEYAARQFEEIARERPYNWVALRTAVDELLQLLGSR